MASSDSTASDAAPLPARDPGFAQQLLRELEGNRVVMVAGGTGSGKSSQIPQLLLDQLGGAVLVTQPRRLAAVAISQWVAEQRGCRLGSEVGYHIGQQRCASRVTRLLFATCGLSLELLRTNGPAALEPYSVVVLDEVHERSSESDLVLACIRRYMARELPRLKLVLMSATFRADIYREFFADLGGEGERIKLVHVPQLQQDLASRVLGQHELRTAERYLDDAINRAEQLVEQQRLGLLSGLSPSFASMETAQFRALERSMCRPGSRNAKDVESLRPGAPDTCTLHQLVCCLIASIEQGIQPPLLTRRVGASSSRMDVARTTLVFLPTYRSLEELHGLLSGLLPGRLALSVLHSSVDLTECLKAIQNQSSGSTHNVILATNLAESSLTIAGVSTVIDYCRCNQIHWQHESKLSTAKTVWASQSQCDQRRGRTGRTCSGTVFRLVPRVAYDRCCPRWEPPELSLSSLHSESLLLLTSAHRAMRNAVDLLAGTLDPPPAAVVEAAHRYLSNIGAIKARSSSRRRSGYEATPYGQALAALPLSLEGARLVLLGAAQGFLREASLLGSIMTTTPAPITKPFGDRRQHEQNLKSYGGDAVTPEDKVGSLMAQLSAFEWWQSQYVDVQRLRRLGICIIAADGRARALPTGASSDICSICLEALHGSGQLHSIHQATEPSVTLTCGHTFHTACIRQWLAESACCPTCRATVPDSLLLTDGQSGDSGSSATAEVRWCESEKLVRTSLLAVHETAAQCYSALSHLDLDLIYDPKNLRPEAWRAPEGRAAMDGLDKSVSCLVNVTGDEEGKLRTLLATVLSQAATRLAASEPRSSTTSHDIDDTRSVCTFWLAGSCRNAQSCRFRHFLRDGEEMPVCRFGARCRFGAACRFRHPDRSTGGGAALSIVAASDAEVAAGVLVGGRQRLDALVGGYRRYLQGKAVLLIGTGDFSFAEALVASGRLCAVLLATSLDDASQLCEYYPGVEVRLAELVQMQCAVLHGIDATALHENEQIRNVVRSIEVINWQFPFNGEDEDSAGNSRLVAAWFRSVARCLQFETAPHRISVVQRPMQLHITLQGDQFARWRVRETARDSFFSLTAVLPFEIDEFHPYEPRRNTTDETFGITRPTTYIFSFLPSTLITTEQ